MTMTLVKLAFAGIRSRLLASALTILLSSAAAATIVLALEVGGTARDPWQRTFDAANGAHVLADVPSQADARAVATLPGVAERDEPVPIAPASVASGVGTDRLLLAGLRSPARVNAPVRTQGTAPPADGIVLERSFADALGLRVGAVLRLAAAGGPIELPIVGTPISPAQPRYPRRNPGLAWVPRGTFERIVPDRSRWSWTQAIRLPDPATAPAFAARAAATLPPGDAFVATWQEQRTEALRDS
jgi:putative ABC transport system permease protein